MAGWVAGQSEVQAEILHQAAVHGELDQPLRPLLRVSALDTTFAYYKHDTGNTALPVII